MDNPIGQISGKLFILNDKNLPNRCAQLLFSIGGNNLQEYYPIYYRYIMNDNILPWKQLWPDYIGKTFNQNGYIHFANGLIIQWIRIGGPSYCHYGVYKFAYPISFINNMFSEVISYGTSSIQRVDGTLIFYAVNDDNAGNIISKKSVRWYKVYNITDAGPINYTSQLIESRITIIAIGN